MSKSLGALALGVVRALFALREPMQSVRVGLVLAAFAIAFGSIGARMAVLAVHAQDPGPVRASGPVALEPPARAEILDRNGELLAANVTGWSLGARPRAIADHAATATALAGVLGMDAQALADSFGSGSSFVWVKKRIFAHERQAIQDLGLPGLVFHERPLRVYPLGRMLSHVVGGVRDEQVEHWGARMVGVAGVERRLEERLGAGGEPVRLSVDRRAQAVLHRELAEGVAYNGAKGGSAVLLDVRTGEIHAMVSLPDYDPNNRPLPMSGGLPDDDPLLNRTAQGLYELGSVMKPITAALAIDRGGATLETRYQVGNGLRIGGYSIREHYIRDHTISLLEVVQRSSNVGSARAALDVGGAEQQRFLRELGLLDRLPIELSEAGGSQPLFAKRWKSLTTATVSYGHGLSITPVHLASAVSTLVGDGTRVEPTLLRREAAEDGSRLAPGDRRRVVSLRTVHALREALRSVVQTRRGTGRRAHVAGYDVGGKTGTADKQKRGGRGYHRDRVISTFVSAFPMHDPQFVLVVSLDEPQGVGDSRSRRHAGRTAAPVAQEIIAGVGVLYGLLPRFEPEPDRSREPNVRAAVY